MNEARKRELLDRWRPMHRIDDDIAQVASERGMELVENLKEDDIREMCREYTTLTDELEMEVEVIIKLAAVAAFSTSMSDAIRALADIRHELNKVGIVNHQTLAMEGLK